MCEDRAGSQHSPSKPVKIFPADAETMRCPSEMFSVEGVTLGVGTAPVDAVDVIGKGSSNLDVHGVESRSDSNASPAALEWVEVVEISSPIDIRSAETDLLVCKSEAGLATARERWKEAVRHQMEDFRGFAGGGRRR